LSRTSSKNEPRIASMSKHCKQSKSAHTKEDLQSSTDDQHRERESKNK
jgi:hypothetical protein